MRHCVRDGMGWDAESESERRGEGGCAVLPVVPLDFLSSLFALQQPPLLCGLLVATPSVLRCMVRDALPGRAGDAIIGGGTPSFRRAHLPPLRYCDLGESLGRM